MKRRRKKRRNRDADMKKKKKNLVIRQDTEQWVPFDAKNYTKCHLTLFSAFKNSQIIFSILVSHHLKTRELLLSKQSQTTTLWWGPWYFGLWVMKTQ